MLLKNSKGWTLVETIVAMAIAAIAMTMIVGILFSSGNIFYAGAAMNETKMLGDNAYNFVAERLRYATDVQLFLNIDDVPDDLTDKEIIYVDSSTDHLFYKKTGESGKGIDFYGEPYYHGNKLAMELYGEGHLLEISVEVIDGKTAAKAYQTRSTIKLLNLNVFGKEIEEGIADPPVPAKKEDQALVLVFSLVPNAPEPSTP